MITIETLVELGANVKLVKVGNKNMYAKSDVRRVQTGSKSESVTSYCKKKNG